MGWCHRENWYLLKLGKQNILLELSVWIDEVNFKFLLRPSTLSRVIPLQIQNCLSPERNYGCVMMQSHLVWKKNQSVVCWVFYLLSIKCLNIARYLYLYLHLCLYLFLDIKGLIDKASLGLQFGGQLAVFLGPKRFQGK